MAPIAAPSVAETGAGFLDEFKTLDPGRWHVAHYDFSHPKFDTDWRASRVAQLDTALKLELSPKSSAENRFDGASIRRSQQTHYGRYDVIMQPARGDGVITGFFTYSGPYYGTRHDEIDIEFLGKDTRRMHVAWFVDGVMQAKSISLGFDAADRPRKYSFEWLPGRIRWYAEDKLIFEHSSADGPVPQVPGFLFANIWAADPSIASWSGLVDPAKAYSATVGEIAFTAASGPLDAEVAATD